MKHNNKIFNLDYFFFTIQFHLHKYHIECLLDDTHGG